MKKINVSTNYQIGFTLIELLVVVSIIGILSALVLAALNNARGKGADGAIKANLVNAVKQAEVFYNTNTAANLTYTNVCNQTSPQGGAATLAANMNAATAAAGVGAYQRNVGAGSTTIATCNDSAGAWAAEVPLKTAGQMWCVDSVGKSKQVTGSSLSSGTDYTCS